MQQINFYQEQFKPKKEQLPAWQFLSILGFVVICLCVISIVLFSFQPDTQAEVVKHQQSMLQKQEQLTKLQKKLDETKENPLLRAELTKLQNTLSNEQALLDYVSSHQLGNKAGFSPTLTAFSEHSIEGVWLTEFALLNAGEYTAINGQTYSADLVPKYIDKLAESEPFQGKTFSVFNLNKSDAAEFFDFQLFTSNRKSN